jgi:predicted GIY-YIG superfamily endonuclease
MWWIRHRPMLCLAILIGGMGAHLFGSPWGSLLGFLPALLGYTASTSLRRINPKSKLHTAPTTVYGFRNSARKLIYIGITRSDRLSTRWAEHADDKKWWPQVAAKEILATYPDRWKALTREALLIRRHRPMHNTMHNRIQGWRIYTSPTYLLRLGKYRDPRRRSNAREVAAVLSARYRLELWMYEKSHSPKLHSRPVASL